MTIQCTCKQCNHQWSEAERYYRMQCPECGSYDYICFNSETPIELSAVHSYIAFKKITEDMTSRMYDRIGVLTSEEVNTILIDLTEIVKFLENTVPRVKH